MPRTPMLTRITRCSVAAGRSGRSSREHAFQLNIELADKMDEEKLDVTAPTIAANPINPMTGGVTYLTTIGSASAGCCDSGAANSGDHGYAAATRPSSSGGKVSAMVSRPASTECACASRGERQDNTRWK